MIIYFTFQFIFGSPTNSMYICFFLVPLCVIRIYRYPQFSEIAFQKENKIPIFSANENNLSLILLHGWLGTEFIWASCFAYILKWWPRNETFHNFVFFFFYWFLSDSDLIFIWATSKSLEYHPNISNSTMYIDFNDCSTTPSFQ